MGKTELAKALAEQLFDDERRLIRIDMSEYMEAHTVSRLLGAPPGYVGFEQGGQLTDQVRRHPHSVVLFDEVEKAHPKVWDVLLQVFDDGRLTDGQGRTVDFKNTVIIMTSNLGSQLLLERGAFSSSQKGDTLLSTEVKDRVMQLVKQQFRPEFLNRIDDICIFTPLSRSHVASIVRLQMASLDKRLAEKDIHLHLTPEALQFVIDRTYDPVYGARPVRRFVERVMGTEISRMLLRGTLSKSSDVTVSVSQGQLAYTVKSKLNDDGKVSAAASAATDLDFS